MDNYKTKTIKFVAGYYRVSTALQEEQKTIETQISAVKDFAQKNGYKIVQEYKDDGWSGDMLQRPALDQLRIDAKRRAWDAVLIYDPDRLARRSAWQEVVTEELKEQEIPVLYVTVPQAKNDEDIIMGKMRGVFAEYERMKIKERFRLGKVRKANEGHVILTEPPYGYDFIKKTAEQQGYLKENKEESKIVRDLFLWVANEHLTLRNVIRRLQELGIKPRKSKRGVWNTSTLSTLLRNKTYIGEGHYGASYAVIPQKPLKHETYKKNKKTSRVMKPETEWIKIKTPEFIDKELFDKVQIQLKTNNSFAVRNKKNEYLLAGKIWCTCGKRRTGEGPMKGKHLYYRCSNRVYSFPLERTCFEKGTNARISDVLAWKKISEMMTSPELLMKKAQMYLNSLNNKNHGQSVDTSKITGEISKLKAEEDRYNKAYGAGIYSVEELRTHILPLKEKIAMLEAQISKAEFQHSENKKPVLPTLDEIKLFTDRARQGLKDLNFSEKQGIVRRVMNTIVVTQEELFGSGRIDITNLSYVKHETGNSSRLNATSNKFTSNYVEHKTSHRHCGVTERRKIHTV